MLRSLLIIAAVALAGCAGASTPAAPTPRTSDAASLDPASESGEIRGQLLTEEQLPVPDTQVALLKTAAEATTDADGRFVFPDLAPGKYVILVERLGFEAVQRHVNVTAGAPTDVQIVLVAVVIAEPYTLLLIHTSYHNLGQQQADAVLQNQLGWNNSLCDSCQWDVKLATPAQALVYQVTGTHAINKPTGPAQEYIDIRTTTAQPRIIWAGNQNLPIRMVGDADLMLEDKDFEYTLICGGSWICFQERRDAYSTFFFLQDAPADYSAVPK